MDAGINRTALILVGPALAGETEVRSALYSAEYDRRYRPQSAESPFSPLEEE
jgi:precorrin-4/cobalt-precorrin-4 C11-methyltransferase